jgi:Fe-S-cluster containining protein
MKKLYEKFKRFFVLKILRKKYQRVGKCKACGKCCKNIHIKHYDHLIKDEEEFENLKKLHYFFNFLEVIEKSDMGLVFACTKLHPETGKCTAYNKRAILCRTYPQEEIFMLGGIIAEECGFSFTPIETFEEVFANVKKKKVKKGNN